MTSAVSTNKSACVVLHKIQSYALWLFKKKVHISFINTL